MSSIVSQWMLPPEAFTEASIVAFFELNTTSNHPARLNIWTFGMNLS